MTLTPKNPFPDWHVGVGTSSVFPRHFKQKIELEWNLKPWAPFHTGLPELPLPFSLPPLPSSPPFSSPPFSLTPWRTRDSCFITLGRAVLKLPHCFLACRVLSPAALWVSSWWEDKAAATEQTRSQASWFSVCQSWEGPQRPVGLNCVSSWNVWTSRILPGT